MNACSMTLLPAFKQFSIALSTRCVICRPCILAVDHFLIGKSPSNVYKVAIRFPKTSFTLGVLCVLFTISACSFTLFAPLLLFKFISFGDALSELSSTDGCALNHTSSTDIFEKFFSFEDFTSVPLCTHIPLAAEHSLDTLNEEHMCFRNESLSLTADYISIPDRRHERIPLSLSDVVSEHMDHARAVTNVVSDAVSEDDSSFSLPDASSDSGATVSLSDAVKARMSRFEDLADALSDSGTTVSPSDVVKDSGIPIPLSDTVKDSGIATSLSDLKKEGVKRFRALLNATEDSGIAMYLSDVRNYYVKRIQALLNATEDSGLAMYLSDVRKNCVKRIRALLNATEDSGLAMYLSDSVKAGVARFRGLAEAISDSGIPIYISDVAKEGVIYFRDHAEAISDSGAPMYVSDRVKESMDHIRNISDGEIAISLSDAVREGKVRFRDLAEAVVSGRATMSLSNMLSDGLARTRALSSYLMTWYALCISLCLNVVSIGVLLELFCSIPDAYTAFVKQMESNLALAESREYCEMVSSDVIMLLSRL